MHLMLGYFFLEIDWLSLVTESITMQMDNTFVRKSYLMGNPHYSHSLIPLQFRGAHCHAFYFQL